jgi:hypothetical protein
MSTDDAKIRLGMQIRHRRETMSPPLTREQLAQAVRMGERRLGDIERGKWDSIRAHNRDAIERILGWEPGSWDAVLTGGEPTISPARTARRADEPDDLVYLMRHAGKVHPETLRTLRVIMETELERDGSHG